MTMTAEDFRRQRRRLQMSQIELAAKIGVHPMTLSRWERGTVKVPMPVAQLIELLDREHRRASRSER
jgi:DNA-binding transcriptional regulator YiaG